MNIRLDHVSKSFGNVEAVKDVSLSIEDGDFFTLLGPSGCGKTTILRMIAGLEKPDQGKIYIGSLLVNELEPKDRDVGLVFQSYALYPHMSVFQNLAFPLEARGCSRDLIKRKVLETAQLLQIAELLSRKPKQLSGGQQQRVALGRAIVKDAKAFLMDEPLSNLDAKLRIKMRGELKRLQKDLGITTVYVTHDQEEAMTMSDRVTILNRGVIQQISKPIDAYINPVNKWVAGFIGSPAMNFFSCHVKLAGETSFMVVNELGGLQIPYDPKTLSKQLVDGYPLTLGVRPEHMTVTDKPNGLVSKARIYVIEPTGEYTIIEIIIENKVYSMKIGTALSYHMGEEIMITFDIHKIYIFDSETGLNLVRR